MYDTKNLIAKINKKPLTLIGMMASGKTTIGRTLAKMLKIPFYDSDLVIEEREGKKISEIFALEGEDRFRQCEKDVIDKLLQIKPSVIALGGGACISVANRQKLKKNAINIWLDVSDEIIIIRARKNTRRPLLNNKDIEKTIKTLSRKRRPIYQQTAQLRVEFEYGMNCQQYTQKIIQTLIEKHKD